MAELDQQEGLALCRALERVLSEELGRAISCLDVSRFSKPWDFEAVATEGGAVLRRVSHTRLTHEPGRKATAEIYDDFNPALKTELASQGVRGYWFDYALSELPTSKRARRDFAVLAATRLAEVIRIFGPRLDDRGGYLDALAAIEQLGSRDAVELHEAFDHISVVRAPDRAAPVDIVGVSDQRWWLWVPPLTHTVLPAIKKKLERHGAIARDLTLVIQLDEVWQQLESGPEVRAALEVDRPAFCSIYLAKLSYPEGRMDLVRVV